MKKSTKIIIGVVLIFGMIGGIMKAMGIETIPEKETPIAKVEKVVVENIKIDQEIINAVIEEVESLDIVRDAAIKVEDEDIILSVIVVDGVNKDTSEDLGSQFAKLLSDTVAMNTNLIGTNDGGYGELFEQYDLTIMVGTGKDNIIARGAKMKNNNRITW